MRYLSETPTVDDEADRVPDQLLKDLGQNEPRVGNNFDIVKKTPHYKYY
jgi:hypothetical protein